MTLEYVSHILWVFEQSKIMILLFIHLGWNLKSWVELYSQHYS